jgi:hypothetical protein
MARGMSRPAAGMRNVTRVDHHHFHGWQVCLKHGGQRHQRCFADEGNPSSSARRSKAILTPPGSW